MKQKSIFLFFIVLSYSITNIYAGDTIVYKCSHQLELVHSPLDTGIYVDALCPILKHEFENGKGTIVFKEPLKKIGNYAFFDCNELSAIMLPSSVTSIGDYAFAWCTGITSISIPESVQKIGQSAFKYVNNISYSGDASGAPWDAKMLNGYVDGYVVYTDERRTTLVGCSSLAKFVRVPSTVRNVKNNTFCDCKKIIVMVSNDIFNSISDSAFVNSNATLQTYGSKSNQSQDSIPRWVWKLVAILVGLIGFVLKKASSQDTKD